MRHGDESYLLHIGCVLRNLVRSLFIIKQMPGESLICPVPHPSHQNPLKSFRDFVIDVHLMLFYGQSVPFHTEVTERCY